MGFSLPRYHLSFPAPTGGGEVRVAREHASKPAIREKWNWMKVGKVMVESGGGGIQSGLEN